MTWWFSVLDLVGGMQCSRACVCVVCYVDGERLFEPGNETVDHKQQKVAKTQQVPDTIRDKAVIRMS